MISEETGLKLEKATLAELGRAHRIEIDKEDTTLIGSAGAPEQIKARIAQISEAIDETTSDYDRKQLEERAARLCRRCRADQGRRVHRERNEGKEVARRGRAARDARRGRGRYRCRRWRRAVASAPRSGAVARRALGRDAGIKIVRRALEEPLRQIVANAGQEPSVVLQRVLAGAGNFGYNVATDAYGDLVAMGVIDPDQGHSTRPAECGIDRKPHTDDRLRDRRAPRAIFERRARPRLDMSGVIRSRGLIGAGPSLANA